MGLLASSLALGILALMAKGGGRLIGCSTLSVGLAVFAVNVLPLAPVGSLAKEVFTLVGCLGGLALLRIGEVPEHGLDFVRVPFVLGVGFIAVGGWVWFGNRRAARSRPPLVVVAPLPAGTYITPSMTTGLKMLVPLTGKVHATSSFPTFPLLIWSSAEYCEESAPPE